MNIYELKVAGKMGTWTNEKQRNYTVIWFTSKKKRENFIWDNFKIANLNLMGASTYKITEEKVNELSKVYRNINCLKNDSFDLNDIRLESSEACEVY